jgi:tetratricopeptide (TPR) repeat protein
MFRVLRDRNSLFRWGRVTGTDAAGSRVRWAFAVLLLLNFAALGWLGLQQYSRHQQRFVTQADTLLVQGDVNGALQALRLHLDRYPEDADAVQRLQRIEHERLQGLLAEAEELLKVDDRAGAVAALKSYLSLAPADSRTRIRLARLYEDLGVRDAAERMYRLILSEPALEDTDPATFDDARRRLHRLVNGWANELKRRADALTGGGDHDAADRLYAEVIELRARNPALDTDTPDRLLALRAFDSTVAARRYAAWLGGRGTAPEDDFSTPFDAALGRRAGNPALFLAERRAERRRMLSDQIWALADRRFGEEDWQSARDAYIAAIESRPLEADPDHDLSLAALRFNLALSEYRLERYAEALARFEYLAAHTPEYERNRVVQLLADTRRRLNEHR